MLRIDAHMHFWKLENGDYDWVKPDLGQVYADHLPENIAPHMEQTGIHKTIAVEAVNTAEETEFLLKLYAGNSAIAGVVGSMELDSASFEEQFGALRARKGLIGLRFRQGWRQQEWTTHPQTERNLRLIEREQFPIDLTVAPGDVPALVAMLEQFPDLHIAIDPAGDPSFPQNKEILDNWQRGMRRVAAHRKVYFKCKLFGLMDISRKEDRVNHRWTPEQIQVFTREVIDIFGIDRAIFGTNWPVSAVVGDYRNAVQVMQDSLPQALSAQEKDAFFGRNAATFYRLDGSDPI